MENPGRDTVRVSPFAYQDTSKDRLLSPGETMTLYPVGTVTGGSEGCVHVCISNDRFYIYAEDLGAMLFLREEVPLFRYDAPAREPGLGAGCARLNRSGRAVLFKLGPRSYSIPRDRFMGIALGEEDSWSIGEIVSDESGTPLAPYPGGRDAE
jgi:hypothetical protein